MVVVVILHPVLRRVYEFTKGNTASSASTANGSAGSLQSSAGADAHFKQRTTFDLYFAILFISVLHGFSALKILLILYMNFNIAMRLPRKAVPLATWLFNIGVLFANETAHGYSYSRVAESILPFPMAITLSKNFDFYGGLIPRWEILFNITVLRLIAFNMDYYWSLDRERAGSPIEVRTRIQVVVRPCYPF